MDHRLSEININERSGSPLLSCVTCEEMKTLEKMADAAGLSYYQMMENAGTLASALIVEELSKADWLPSYDIAFDIKPQVLVFCGKGNNGGDGFVVARKLSEMGFPVSIIFVEGAPTTEDAIANDNLLPDAVERISAETFLETRLDAFPGSFSGVIVDAIYGTGFHGNLTPHSAKVIEWINHSPTHSFGNQHSGNQHSGVQHSYVQHSCVQHSCVQHMDPLHSNKMVVSLDLPSGLSGDMSCSIESSSLSYPLCVKADYTITFHKLKPVHLCIAAQPFLGKIILADIGIDAALE